MTPKEKAEELTSSHFNLNMEWDGVINKEWAKEGALITVNELIYSHNNDNKWYWIEVKQEIEKL